MFEFETCSVMNKLHIQNPCSEKWSKMRPAVGGRHCAVCDITVVDFTNKTEQEILNYLAANEEKYICGKYRAEHVSTPRSNRFKWILIGLTMIFGTSLVSSCRRHVMGAKFLIRTDKVKTEIAKPSSNATNPH